MKAQKLMLSIWMRTIPFLVLFGCVRGLSGSLDAVKPDWTNEQTWTVLLTNYTHEIVDLSSHPKDRKTVGKVRACDVFPPDRYRYRAVVPAEGDTGKAPQIEITCPAIGNHFDRREVLTLALSSEGVAIRKVSLTISSPRGTYPSTHLYPPTRDELLAPVVSADCLQGLPVDYPLFTADTVSVKDATGATIEQRVEAKTTEDGKPYVIVEMVKTKGETTTKTILRWEPGKPWWTQMDQYRNGEHIIHAELVLGDTPADGKPPAAPADRK